MHDLVIIGAGPCGLSAAIAGCRGAMNVVVLERGALTNTIVGYPLHTNFYSTAPNLTIGGIPWPTTHPHPTRDDALAYYRAVVEHEGLKLNLYETAERLERQPDGTFVVHSTRRDGTAQTYSTRAVVVASGSYDHPNRLLVPGGDSAHVHHYYTEGHPYYGQRVTVVGGGNSAAEAALDLFNHGAHVTLVHVFNDFDPRVKPWVLADVRSWIEAGQITVRWQSHITAITADTVTLQTATGAETFANDWVFALIGYRPDTTLLEAAGVTVDDDAIPTHDPHTFETNVPGIFIAGVLAAGALPSKIFIENGRNHGPRIVQVLRERWNSEEHRA